MLHCSRFWVKHPNGSPYLIMLPNTPFLSWDAALYRTSNDLLPAGGRLPPLHLHLILTPLMNLRLLSAWLKNQSFKLKMYSHGSEQTNKQKKQPFKEKLQNTDLWTCKHKSVQKGRNVVKKTRRKSLRRKNVWAKSHTPKMTRGGNKVNKNEAATKNSRQNQDLRAGFAEPWIWRR